METVTADDVSAMLAWVGGDESPSTLASARRRRTGRASAAATGTATAGQGESRLGLSPSHISPRRPDGLLTVSVSYSVGGSLLVLKGPGVGAFHRRSSRGVQLKGGAVGKRGRISGFSPSSRLRLLRWLASLNRSKITTTPLFITLTYPATWPEDPARVKRDIDAFGKAFMRRYPAGCFLWKVEAQKRGAPHYHCLVFNVGYVSHQWAAATWNRIVAGGPDHLKAGTEVRRVRSWRGVMAYASKYFSKQSGGVELTGIGRHWGIVGRANLPVELVTLVASLDDFYRLRRAMARYRDSQRRPGGRRRVRWRARGPGQRYSGGFCFMPCDQAERLIGGLALSATRVGVVSDQTDNGLRAWESWDGTRAQRLPSASGRVGAVRVLPAIGTELRHGAANAPGRRLRPTLP